MFQQSSPPGVQLRCVVSHGLRFLVDFVQRHWSDDKEGTVGGGPEQTDYTADTCDWVEVL